MGFRSAEERGVEEVGEEGDREEVGVVGDDEEEGGVTVDEEEEERLREEADLCCSDRSFR